MSEVSCDKYSIRPAHDILYVDLKGTWTAEDTLQFVAEYKKQVSRYFAQSWACVLKIKNLDMLIDDNFQIQSFISLNTWSYIKGMSDMVIITGTQSRDMLLYQFEEIISAKQPFDMEICTNDFLADQWLRDRGFRAKQLEERRKSA